MMRDLPAFDDLIASGDLAPVRHWLTNHVHQHGRMKRPADIMADATGEGTNPEPLLAHLSHKYQSLYRWS
jgi:carboxypeptidase Taq